MNRISRLALRLGASAFALGALSSGQAFAAAADEAVKPAGQAIEEVVVTANRREESLQKVPLSITAVSGANIIEQGISDYEGLVRTVPGVISTGASNFNKMTIRGIETSQTTSSIGAQRSTSIYFDDLPLTTFSVVTPDITPYDISRVEVLRGPQGTLFGSGSLAGAIRYITNKPNLNATQASVDVEGGASDGNSYRRRASGMVNVPLIEDKLALRIAATYKDDDGYIDNVGTGQKNSNTQKDTTLRAALRWQATDRLSATLTGTRSRNRSGDTAFYNPALGLRKSSEDAPFAVSVDLKTLNLAVSYDLGWADLQSSTTLAEAPDAWNLELFAIIPGVPLHLREVVETKSTVQEFRLVSKKTGKFDWVAGAYYLNQKSDQQDVLYLTTAFVNAFRITGLPTNLAPGSAYSNDLETKENYELAGFGEANYQLTDTLKLTAGVRVTDSNFTATITGQGGSSPAIFGALFTGGNVALTLLPATRREFSTGHVVKVTPKVSVSWQPDADKTFYVTASEGFRRAQPNGVVGLNGGHSLVNPSDPAIIPASAQGDNLWNFELGAKTLWLNESLRANFAAYYINWSDMQVPLVRSSDQAPYVGNIGKARSIGLEGELEGRLSDALRVGLNFTVQQAKVTELSALQGLISGAAKDSKLASPEFRAGGFVKYDWDLGTAGQLYARLDAQHIGSYPNAFPNTPGVGTPSGTYAKIPSYEKVDVSMGWSRDNLGATLYVDNLLDNDTPIYINPANFSFNRYSTLRPRTVGMRLSWKY